MKLQIMSDLHLECHRDGGEGFLAALDPSGVDVLVLAGDIVNARDEECLNRLAETLSAKYPHIVYVPGNHEYYGAEPKDIALNLLLAEDRYRNFHTFGVPGVRTIDGQRFVGGTMWFRKTPEAEAYRHYLNDFRAIRYFEPWVYEQNEVFCSFISNDPTTHGAFALQPTDIVVTHHLPAPESVDPRFASHPTNAFFLCDVSDVIRERQPKLWIHGHTHSQVDARIGATRIVANPHGYPNEINSIHAFQDRFVVEV